MGDPFQEGAANWGSGCLLYMRTMLKTSATFLPKTSKKKGGRERSVRETLCS